MSLVSNHTSAPSRRLVTPAEAATVLRVGRSTVYELMGRGRLESVTIGRSRRVPVEALDRFVESLREEAGSDAWL